MAIDRNRILTPAEPHEAVSGDVPNPADAAQPPEEHPASPPVSGALVPTKNARRRSRKKPDVTRPLVIMRLQTEPKQLTVNQPAATAWVPDWRLGVGTAVVLFGFVVAYGTYATLSTRASIQAQLDRFSGHHEHAPAAAPLPAPAPQVAAVPAPVPVSNPPKLDAAQASPPQPIPVVKDAAKPAPAASSPASTHNTVVARSAPPQAAPVRPPVVAAATVPAPSPAVTAKPAPTPAKPVIAAIAPPPVTKQAAVVTAPVATVSTVAAAAEPKPPVAPATPEVVAASPRTRSVATLTQKERRAAPKAAKGNEAIDENERPLTHEPAVSLPPPRPAPPAPFTREAVASAQAAPTRPYTPPPAHAAAVQIEAEVPVRTLADRELFLKH